MTGRERNERALALVSRYLCECPAFVTPEMLGELSPSCPGGREEAYALLMASAMGLDVADDAEAHAVYRDYLSGSVRELDAEAVQADAYLRAVRADGATERGVTFGLEQYAPCEAFVRDDLRREGARVLPQLGFFGAGFRYPALRADGRVWMTVTPNEINTMRGPIDEAHGDVLTLGLGLGYFAFHALRKPSVRSLTVVENDPRVIALFEKRLLPCFEGAQKLRVVRDDAFAFARREYPRGRYSFVFADLWHDVSDGLPMRERLRALEPLAPGTAFRYWIEASMDCY